MGANKTQQHEAGLRSASAPPAPGTNRIGRETEFCCGPGIPYEEDCLGNGRIPVDQRGEARRCPKCKVERRRRHMRRRSSTEPPPARRRSGRDNRPASFAEALGEAHRVLSQRAADSRREHPEVRWRTTYGQTNDGDTVEFESIDLRHSINKS